MKEIYNSLDSETQELLKDIGADSVDFDSMFGVTPQKIWALTKKLITGNIEAPTRSAVRLISVIILIAILNASLPRTRESKQLSALSEPYSV